MATKNPIFTSVISGSPTITSEKLIGSENSLMVSVRGTLVYGTSRTWICLLILAIASLKEFLTLMPFTNGAEAQQIQTDKFFMVLTLIGLRPDLESVRDQILASPSVPSLDDVFARLLRLSSTQTLSTDGPLDSSVLASQTNSRGGRSGNRLHGRPPRTAQIAQSSDHLLSRPDSAASSTSQSITLTGSDYDVSPISGSHISFCCLDRTGVREDDWHRRESQGLYHLTSPSSPSLHFHHAPLLIHSRLGHPSLSKFQKMVPRFSTLSSLACESCQLGKHTRVSFPKRLNNRAKSPFELVHTDVWGPCRTVYFRISVFVTFIDDYSRCTWLFLMKNRAELFSIFQKFYAEIQTQFNVSIRVLRSDNAREYFSTPFTSFMSQHGILHQSSCAYTPQQNGVAERKNRHLVETARTLFSIVMFFFVLGGLVLTACYLINRMPHLYYMTKSLIPSFFLPNLFISFLLVSLVVLVLFILSHWTGQALRQGYEMHLLGILSLQKGYRCYSPDTHRYFLSADVTFFEDSPFFSSSNLFPFLKYCHFPIYPPLQMRSLVLFRFIIVDIVLLLLLSLQLRYLMTHLLSHRFLLPRLSSTDHLPIAL
ncbi:Retrovirus-related Pol polyprotein from transposon TNT 1-94 [Vitis vinifera]|uniref:Retrovirus-related Pol polyprotein from transposon TNT 1-94 n=1 Tax=Vitis vinifera TaxID=29760 RepID=A0A438ERJ5_VITVI|nr:Retrovirus-related Pol polyprotein from transposon TNT 1-94 [Vitis vinifera]